MSDVFGGFVDLTNGAGDDAADKRWLLGEELPTGPSRSMSNPPDGGDPDKMTSEFYTGSRFDLGGVHTNSGVGNKAACAQVVNGTYRTAALAPARKPRSRWSSRPRAPPP